MTSVDMIEGRPLFRSAGAAAGAAFASIEIHRDVAAVEPLWTDLLGRSLATPYQTPAFLRAWSDHAAEHERTAPLIAVARDGDGAAVALLPFGLRRSFGVTTAAFLGGTHVNYNMPVVRRDRLAAFDAGEVARLIRETARAGAVDLFVLRNQPMAWNGFPNPFAALPRQAAPDEGYSGPLAESLELHLKRFVSAKTRSAQRRKMRRFEEQGVVRLYRAESADDRERVLEAYFRQKAQRLGARGVDNPFAVPGVDRFIRAAAGLDGAGRTVDLYGFDLDEQVIATFAVICDADRMCGMFNSITSGDPARYSPGELLLNFMVEDAITRGMTRFDLGVGAAAYKQMYCPDSEPLFDSIFGVSALGRAVAAAAAAKTAAKARIKANPTAYGLVERLRKLRAKPVAATETSEAKEPVD
ncbi:GNAT family N-acetyltransferase [Methylopila sp. 73B]|uniref:GNAT family N-acetyltransferase n=1 Tax=Methylopila sp. 73B TaxID=1120792 RepID=UPI00036BD581|nr:GNAT family N-acetyltransferase [Methylopila sp. 73B]